MIVNYKKAGVWIIQFGKMVDAPLDSEGKRTQEKVFSGEGIRIVPGLNTISDQVWAEISKYSDVQRKIESGLLEVIENPKSGSASSKTKGGEASAPVTASAEIESLDKFDQKKAISVVGGQMDADVLTSWRRKEKRPMVLKAIKDQLEVVSNADKAFDGKD